MVTRRAVITGIAGIAGGLSIATIARPMSRLDKLVDEVEPILKIRNMHTDEVLDKRFFGPTGYDMDAVSEINWIMRDWRQDEAIQIDERLMWCLATLRMAARKSGHSGTMRLHSGYRSRMTNTALREQGINAAMNSFHIKGKAADFSMEGIPTSRIADYAEWLEVGGIGHYTGRFIHIDSGPYRHWTG